MVKNVWTSLLLSALIVGFSLFSPVDAARGSMAPMHPCTDALAAYYSDFQTDKCVPLVSSAVLVLDMELWGK
jgi:hypothetical protein